MKKAPAGALFREGRFRRYGVKPTLRKCWRGRVVLYLA